MHRKIKFTLLDLAIVIFIGLIVALNIQETNTDGLRIHLIAKSKSELSCKLLVNKFSDNKYEQIDSGNTNGFFYRMIKFELKDHTVLLTERDMNNILFSFEMDMDNKLYLYRLDFYKGEKQLASIPAESLLDRVRLSDTKNKSLINNTIFISNEKEFNISIQMSDITSAYNFHEAGMRSIPLTILPISISALILSILLPIRFKKIVTVLLSLFFIAHMENYYLIFNYKYINMFVITAVCTGVFLLGYMISGFMKKPKIFYGLSVYFLGMVLYLFRINENNDIFMGLFLISLSPVLDIFLVKVKQIFQLSLFASVIIIFFVMFNVIPEIYLSLTLLPFYCLGRKIRGVRFTFVKEENRYLPVVFLTFSGLFIFVFSALPGVTQNALLDGMIFATINDSYSINVYVPLLYIIFTTAVLSGLSMLFMFYKRNHNLIEYFYEIDFHCVIKKMNNYIFIFFFVILSMYLSNWFVLGKMVHNFYFGITSVSGLLNFYVLIFIFVLLYSLFGKKISTIMMTVVVLIIMIPNFIKLHYLKEPFYPWEVYLVKEAFVIARNYIGVIFYVLLGVAALAALIFLCKNFRAILQLIGKSFTFTNTVLSVVIVSLIFNNFFDDLFLRSLGLTNTEMNWKVDFEEFKENGLFFQEALYLKNIANYMFTKPLNYSEQAILEIKDNLPDVTNTDDKNMNIIVIMNESFFDLTQINSLEFNENITETFNKYKKADIVSSNFGGGTANVEFELLTGFSNYFFSNIMAYSSYIKRPTPSIVSAFKENGYNTVAIHPFHANFYRRDLVYDYLGFDEFIDITKIKNRDIKGEFISDESVVDEIIDLMNRDDNKKFIFAVTMQNHGGYSPDRYPNLAPLFATDQLTAAEISELNTYAEGVKDSDLSLKKLIDEVNTSKQPTIIYFFGDHLPSLYNTLKKLGAINSDLASMYQNGFAIYSNYKKILPVTETVSLNQMALKILKDSGIEYPAYFNILDELYNAYPVLQDKVMVTDSSSEALRKYRMIQYDLLIGNKYILMEE